MAAPIEFTPSHLGHCVENLERSLRFYCDGLGFEKGEIGGIEIDSEGPTTRIF